MKEIKFPGGEVHVQLNEEEMTRYEHRADLWSSDDVMQMLLRNNALQPSPGDLVWTIPYVPYARQDRRANEGEPLSIQVMANLINSMQASEVKIWDPHSDVTPALINNVTVIPQEQLVHRLIGTKQYCAIVAPDAGATKKALKVAQRLGIPLVQAHKTRDTETGQITGTRILDPIPDSSLPLLVVDDICDGGRTFIELGKCFYNKSVDLYITHGIFSQGFTELLAHYDHIYCPNPKRYATCILNKSVHAWDPKI